MRTHGWVGAPPTDDDEALNRILDAVHEIVLRERRAPRVAEVARDLGISRGTVYRYTDDGQGLLLALAQREALPFVQSLASHLAGEVRPASAVVEAVLFVIDRLPENAALGLAFSADSPASGPAAGVTSPEARAFGTLILKALDVDWAVHGFDESRLELLVEQMLRVVQSFLIDPGTPPRHGDELHSYLSMWFVPTIEAIGAGRF